MFKKVLGIVPLLLLNLLLLTIFVAIYIPTLRTCPEHFLSGYSLLMVMNIGLFTLTGYLMVSLIKHTEWSIQFGGILGVTILHAYFILVIVDNVSSCPINQKLSTVGSPLNVVWSFVILRIMIVTQ